MSRLLIEHVLPRAIVQSWSLPGALVKETQKIVWRSDWNSVRLFRRFFLKNLFIQLFFDVFFLRCRRRCLPRPTSGPHIPSGSVSNPFLCVCRVAHAPYPMCSRVTDRLVRLYNFQTSQTRAHTPFAGVALSRRALQTSSLPLLRPRGRRLAGVTRSYPRHQCDSVNLIAHIMIECVPKNRT